MIRGSACDRERSCSFPVNKIKIDRCFIRDIESSAEATAIIRAIGVLGPSLGTSATVEGAETETQARLVRNLGCTDMQGYFISRPVPDTAIPGLIASLTRRPLGDATGGG